MGLNGGCTGLGLKVEGFTKVFLNQLKDFVNPSRAKKKSLFFSKGGVFSLDPPFNG
jgi:hypothetical protein